MAQNQTAVLDTSHSAVPKKTPCGADAIIVLWTRYKEQEKEMADLLDRALTILASTSDFPEKIILEATIRDVRTLVGFFS